MNDYKIFSPSEEFSDKIKNEILGHTKTVYIEIGNEDFSTENPIRRINFFCAENTEINVVFEGKFYGEAFQFCIYVDDIFFGKVSAEYFSDYDYTKMQKSVFLERGNHVLKLHASKILPLFCKEMSFSLTGRGVSIKDTPQMSLGEGNLPIILKLGDGYKMFDQNLTQSTCQALNFDVLPVEVKTFCVGETLQVLFKSGGFWRLTPYGSTMKESDSLKLCCASDCAIVPIGQNGGYVFFVDKSTVYYFKIQGWGADAIMSTPTVLSLGGGFGKVKKIWGKFNEKNGTINIAVFSFFKTTIAALETTDGSLTASATRNLPTSCAVSVCFDDTSVVVGDIDKGVLSKYSLDLSNSEPPTVQKLVFCAKGHGIVASDLRCIVYENGKYKTIETGEKL